METGENKFPGGITQEAALSTVSYIDNSFVSNHSLGCYLAIGIDDESILLSVFDPEKRQFLALERHVTPYHKVSSFKGLSELLELSYKKSKVFVSTPKCTLIPTALFDPDAIDNYINFNHKTDQQQPRIDTLSTIGSKNIYAFPSSLENKIQSQFPQASIHHHSSVLLESAAIRNKHNKSQKAHVHFFAGHFDLFLFNEGKLIFHNIFSYDTIEDIAYYILFAFEQIKINPDSIELHVSGTSPIEGDALKILGQYIPNISHASKAGDFLFSNAIPKASNHHFFNLFCLEHCAL